MKQRLYDASVPVGGMPTPQICAVAWATARPAWAGRALVLVGCAALLLTALSAPTLAAVAADPTQAGPENLGFQRPPLDKPDLMAVSLIKVVLLVLFAGGVFYVVNWSFLDVRFVQTRAEIWNSVMLGGAVAALAAAILAPFFAVGLPLGILIFAGAALVYVKHRNALVTPPLMVLTPAHWERVKSRSKGERLTTASASGPITAVGRDILFMGMDDLPLQPDLHSQVERDALTQVEQVMYHAIRHGASAVGYLVRPHGGEVRLRIGGEMADGGNVARPAAEVFPAIVKRLAALDPTEVRKPQEGRIRAVVGTHTYEIRVKSAGTVRGEQLAIRIIDVAASQMRLEDLGLSPQHVTALRDALGVKPGLVVLSSPKDSGLTTTLHACLRVFDRYINNVVAFEPRVEIEVENVQHVAVNQDDGPTAAAEVRSRIRLEPDIITFDSLYLPEAAQVLAEAMESHIVVVGVRAADTTEALGRLTTMFGSVAPLARHLQLIANQRVVRTLCRECREAYRPNPDFLRKANLASSGVNVLYRPRSHAEVDKQGKPLVCPACHNERYLGRTGLFELMPLDAEARDMIGRSVSAQDVRMHARKQGMLNLQDEGLQLVIEGLTSIEEVQRAIKQTA